MRDHGNSSVLEVATKEHVVFAFETLVNALKKRTLPEPTFPDASTALFVTWKTSPKRSSDHPRLRGCIGILEPRQLHKALRDYTLTSALNDKRFEPIRLSEVPGLECTVSLISCFETADSWNDWEIGQHGLIIEFVDPEFNCRRSATFLPEVAAEQCWSKEETIDALIKKAGHSGHSTSSIRGQLTVTRYQSTTCTLTYAEFMEHTGALQPEKSAGMFASCASALA